MIGNFHTVLKATAVGSALSLALLTGCKAQHSNEKIEVVTRPELTLGSNISIEDKPNIAYIILDDLGFSDFGSYGSEIKTPNIDRLAKNGLRYNNFHVTPLCSPTRASLLTGRNHHSVGMGMVSDYVFSEEYTNYQGRVVPEAGTIAEVLKENEYTTFGVGKWHLTPGYQVDPAGSFENWPLEKGFQRFYGFLGGETDQYVPELVEDNHFIETMNEPDYHLSEDLVRKANQYIQSHVSGSSDRPFFLNLAFSATHSPLQVPEEYIEMYDGVYDKGWDEIRQERFEKQKDLGIVPADAKIAPMDPSVKSWDSLSEDQKRLSARFMQTYAGFLTHTDEQIGRFIEALEKTGELDNTIIVLLSDNGATAAGGEYGTDNFIGTLAGFVAPEEDMLKRLDDIGSEDFQAVQPKGWSQVSNTPFKNYKGTTYEGGVRTPLIVHWPSGIKDKGEIRTQYAHVIDISPTILDILDSEFPKTLKGIDQMPVHGVSLKETFDNKDASEARTTQYYHMVNNLSIYHEGWKAVTTHEFGQPLSESTWELYNVAEDFSDANDVAKENPEIIKEMQSLWKNEADKYNVQLFNAGLFNLIAQNKSPEIPENRNKFKYYRDTEHIGVYASPKLSNKSYTITAPINRSNDSDEGVLVSEGDQGGGYSLFIKDNQLFYEYNLFGKVQQIKSDIDVPIGKSTIRFEFGLTDSLTGDGALYINDKKVGESTNIETAPLSGLSFEGFNIGKDLYSPVSKLYKDKGEFKFTGDLEYVTFEMETTTANY